MNNYSLKRREFIIKSCMAGLSGCALLAGARLFANDMVMGDKANLKKVNYCGYQCPSDCKMKKATLTNNVALKKEAYADWRVEKKYGIAFDPEKITCYGCKVPDKKVGLIAGKCAVRACAIEKGYECCIQCDGLATCDKEIWTTFPDFHKSMIELQKQYKS